MKFEVIKQARLTKQSSGINHTNKRFECCLSSGDIGASPVRGKESHLDREEPVGSYSGWLGHAALCLDLFRNRVQADHCLIQVDQPAVLSIPAVQLQS